MYCGIGECRQIPVQTDEFVQILNSNGNHWVIIYAVTCAPDELQVYDSLYRTVSKEIKEFVDTHRNDRTMPPMVMPCTPKSVFYIKDITI